MSLEPQIRGAAWRIWDLHVHTPSSLINAYGPDDDTTWEKFLDALESLPRDQRVIGINDYWFLDGYKKVRAAKESGRLSNIEAIFPVVEMRLDQFGGVDGDLRRVNAHVIFDPDLDPAVIESQFLTSMHNSYALAPGVPQLSWNGTVSRESLADLGRQIKESVPEGELFKYGTDLIEGFNNLNVTMESLRKVLNENSFIRGRAILALGKTEWADLKWNSQSIASKKTLVNEARLLFTAFENAADWPHQVQLMKDAGVNHRILDCSDAHTWADDTTTKDRLGSCSTWLNTTPTFAGLLHALTEFEQRVFVGLEPAALQRHRKSPEQYIDHVRISSTDLDQAPAFDYALPLNAGFVTIVGNKGQGKSALLDCIALAGNSSRTDEFAFLTTQRFLSPSNKSARYYQSTIQWLNGAERTVAFGDGFASSVPERVEYLPQRYVERVCTIDPLSPESHEFEDELREVLFTHIPDDERAGQLTFDSLLRTKTEAAKSITRELRAQLRKTAGQYKAATDFARDNVPSDVASKLELKRTEIRAAESDLVDARSELNSVDESRQGDTETARLREASVAIQKNLDEQRIRRTGLLQSRGTVQQWRSSSAELERRATQLETEARAINTSWSELNAELELVVGPLVEVVVAENRADEFRKRLAEVDEAAARDVTTCDELIASLEAELSETNKQLATVDGARELARQRVLQVEERLSSLHGSSDLEGSEVWLSELHARAIEAPAVIQSIEDSLIELARQVHDSLRGELSAVTDLYGPASEFIAASPVVKNAGLEFKAELSVVSRMHNLSNLVDGRRSPDLVPWISRLPERIDGQDWDQIERELRSSFLRLSHERGAEAGASRHPDEALRKDFTVIDFVTELLALEWIEVRFGLTGNGLPLAQLSPGQRGLVLALFYLIVDLRTTPLLLDQPEENLDNATIATLLVPAIQEAAGRRQTIIVTHNANLAIVGDADQIVHCTVTGGVFGVSSGSISELAIAQDVVDILEGTKPAFDKRGHRYDVFPLH